MNILATQRCIDLHQEIDWMEKRTVETSFEIKLFADHLAVKSDVFPIASIADISYRISHKQDAIGFLYLYTSQGIRTYYIKEEPILLVKVYRRLKYEQFKLR